MTRTGFGDYIESVRGALPWLRQDRVAERLRALDASLCTDNESAAGAISRRLGWLTVIDKMERQIAGLQRFAREVRESGFETIVLLGKGGASPGACAIQRLFGAGGRDVLRILLGSDVQAGLRAPEQSLSGLEEIGAG